MLGHGPPVTVFAHGIGGDRSDTRVLAAAAPGTRVLFDFRGHGASDALPGGWDYDVLADDLARVADARGATCAVGLSLGCGALLRLLLRDPQRFARIALVLPAALDVARADGAVERLRDLGSAIDAGDREQVATLLLDELPAAVHRTRAAQVLLARRAARLVQRPAPVPLSGDRPLADRAVLRDVRAPALVVGQRDDALHPLAVAEELVTALPAGRLHVLPPGGVFWTATRQLQSTLADHFSGVRS